MGLICLIKTNNFFIFNICCFYTTSVRFYSIPEFTALILHFQKRRPSAILDFKIFGIFAKNSNYRPFLRPHAKFGEDLTIRGRVIAYFRFSK